MEQFTTSFTPYGSLLKTGAYMIDPYVRDPEGLGEQFAARLPLLSKTVPEKIGQFGEPVERTGQAWLPVVTTTAKASERNVTLIEQVHQAALANNKIEQKLARLKEQGKDDEASLLLLEHSELISSRTYQKVYVGLKSLEEARTKIEAGIWYKTLTPEERQTKIKELNEQILNDAIAYGPVKTVAPEKPVSNPASITPTSRSAINLRAEEKYNRLFGGK